MAGSNSKLRDRSKGRLTTQKLQALFDCQVNPAIRNRRQLAAAISEMGAPISIHGVNSWFNPNDSMGMRKEAIAPKDSYPLPDARWQEILTLFDLSIDDLDFNDQDFRRRCFRQKQPTVNPAETMAFDRDAYLKKLAAIQYVKTVWQIDRKVSLHDFYFPTRLEIEGKPTPISSLAELNPSQPILIQGVAGQGKSMFLRYLCSRYLPQALCSAGFQAENDRASDGIDGAKLAVFIELRGVKHSGKVLNLIFNALALAAQTPIDQSVLQRLYLQNKMIVFMDGFDEIPKHMQEAVFFEIEALIQQFPKWTLVVSSRPNSGIEYSQYFQLYRIAYLDYESHYDIFYHLTQDAALSKAILTDLDNSPISVRFLLKTHLIITLIVILYRARQSIPSSFSDLYEELFFVMISRHDNTKPVYSRERACALSDRQYKKILAAFCYLTRLSGLSLLSEEQVLKYAEQAIDIEVQPAGAREFLDDLVNVCCFLVKDGINFSFLHKSIEEYFSACAIASHPDDAVSAWYQALLADGDWRFWVEELYFLEDIDQSRFRQYFLLASLKNCFQLINEPQHLLAAVYRASEIQIRQQANGMMTMHVRSNQQNTHSIWFNFGSELAQLLFHFFKSINDRSALVMYKRQFFGKKSNQDNIVMPLLKAVDIIAASDDLLDKTRHFLKSKRHLLDELQAKLKQDGARGSLLQTKKGRR